MASTEKQRLVLSIINFLQQEAERSSPDRRESVEVAMQCLEVAFELDGKDDGTDYDGDHEDLLTMYTRNVPSRKAHVKAEEFKTKGNDLMRGGMYEEAVEQYTRALKLSSTNAVYYCNRAAAYSRLDNHINAISDCEEAVRLDPQYAKAYGRLGIAYSSLNRFEEARDAYKNALREDPGNSMYEENLKLAEERLASNPTDAEVPTDPANIDISQFMNNPNLLQMASQMLNDPGIRNVMSGILHTGNENRNPNIDALLQMGQQLAQQMQINNPGFVDNLRRQFSSTEGVGPENSSNTTNGNTDKKEGPPGPKNEDPAV